MNLVTIWIQLKKPAHLRLTFSFFFFLFFMHAFLGRDKVTIHTHKVTIHALFIGPTTTLFKKKYLKWVS